MVAGAPAAAVLGMGNGFVSIGVRAATAGVMVCAIPTVHAAQTEEAGVFDPLPAAQQDQDPDHEHNQSYAEQCDLH